MTDLTRLSWHKSSYSNGSGGNCLETATAGLQRLVRDSKDTAGPVLSFRCDTWASFVDAVREGRLT